MKKRIFLNLLAVLLLVMAMAPAAFATDTHIADGTCGEGITWSLDGYTLTISGSGEMADGAPWIEHKDHIEHVVLTGGITKVGKDAFYKYDRIETVDFGDALVEIGERAFYGCEDIDYIHLPQSFRRFGAEAFRDCYSLKYVYCDGGMPRFNDSCLWTGNYISVFYHTNNPWHSDAVHTLVQNFGGRLGIMMGNFDEAAVAENLAAIEATAETTEPEETTEATEATEAPTEAPTEAATEPLIVLVTEPPTVPTTVPETTVPETTVPETTEETTVPTTEAVETTEWELFTEETESSELEEKVNGSSWIGIVMIAGVLTFLISGAMIFRSVKHRGGRYRG